MTLMSRECSGSCKEDAEFALKFIITSLELMDDDEENGFDEILIVLTFDKNVIKIDGLKEDEEAGGLKFVGRELMLLLTPEKMGEKLSSCPILMNLSRGCNELGTASMHIGKCFTEAVKCDDFESETNEMKLKFTRDDDDTAKMTLVLQVARIGSSHAAKATGNAKKNIEKQKKREIALKQIEEASDDFSEASSSLTCETDLCPQEEGTTTYPESAMTRSKCCSDIATSLEIQDFPKELKTFCGGCGRFSISGVTCENKEIFPQLHKSPDRDNSITKSDKDATGTTFLQFTLPSNECTKTSTRICPECFEDLSVIARDAPCPKCIHNDRLDRKLVSFKSEPRKLAESENIRDCIKSLLEEIFLETKDRLIADWHRLKRPTKRKARNNQSVNKRSRRDSLELAETTLPRCSKVRRTKAFSSKKFNGLRAKHPGVIVGHRLCQGDASLVPKNMGWLWNVSIEGLSGVRRGWRPGSVKLSVARIMKVFLTKPVELPAPDVEKNAPTLKVQKKNGDYTIVMNPLSDGKKTSPIVFRIMKSEEDQKRSMARKLLKTRGVKMCNCGAHGHCNCLTPSDVKHLRCEMENISREFCLQTKLSIRDLTASSESEIDVEFTPPSAMKSSNPRARCRPVKTVAGATQYEAGTAVTIDVAKKNELKAKEKASSTRNALTGKKSVGQKVKPGGGAANDKDTKDGQRLQVLPIIRDFTPPQSCCEFQPRNCGKIACNTARCVSNCDTMNFQCRPQPRICSSRRWCY